MIRPLRQRHRIVVLSLAVILPAAFAVGIATRKEVPASRPEHGLSEQAPHQTELWARSDLWQKTAIHTRLLRVGPERTLGVELVSTKRIVRPDVQVYWVPGEGDIQHALPDDAFLLGSFDQSSTVPLSMPEAAKEQTGALVLYSLADQEIIATSKPFSAQ